MTETQRLIFDWALAIAGLLIINLASAGVI